MLIDYHKYDKKFQANVSKALAISNDAWQTYLALHTQINASNGYHPYYYYAVRYISGVMNDNIYVEFIVIHASNRKLALRCLQDCYVGIVLEIERLDTWKAETN